MQHHTPTESGSGTPAVQRDAAIALIIGSV
jgi:hypothetical protein